LLRARLQTNILQCGRRYSNFVRAATNPENKSQIYISRTDDPYINLSIEHYLLQKTPADSTVLFLYTNRPCVIIGRNQNPWVETNLGMLRNSGLNADLVRRRSGGGTVWHDEGNINYSVICPTSNFHRDKHAEMVVRALRKLGLNQVRVNERHDIVYNKTIDVEISPKDQRLGDTGQEGGLIEKTFKISGSAYKLTRLRSLHHGTCIAWSRNINAFSRYLRSPAKSLIVARGVESVSSPVTNLEKDPVQVEEAVVSEFSTMYEAGEPLIVTDAEAAVPEIAAGLKELTVSTPEATSAYII
jgi:lipoate-protein ligase A